jgi:hypothetical protein
MFNVSLAEVIVLVFAFAILVGAVALGVNLGIRLSRRNR